MLSSYYFFRGYFLDEPYDALELLKPAMQFIAISSVTFLWGVIEQRQLRKKKKRSIKWYEED